MPSQQEFKRAIFDQNKGVPQGLSCKTDDTIERRFSVYRNNVIASLIEALQDGFTKTQALVGVEFFRHMAREFIANNPPKSAVLHQYGENFPQFIDTFPPAQKVPYLADIATIEIKRRTVYFAADDQKMRANQLDCFMQSDIANATITLVAALEWHSSQYPIYDIWLRIDNEHHSIAHTPQDLLIVRENGEVKLTPLKEHTSTFFDGLRLGLTIEQAAKNTLIDSPNADISALVGLAVSHMSAFSINK